MPSIFSRIVSGELPAHTVYEDAETLAFMDINPASRGHTLVICKEEYPDLLALPPETLTAVTRTVQRVALALRDALKPDGINVVQSNGAAAGQEVFHYHVHLIPRWEGDRAVRLWKPQSAEQADLQALAAQIGSAVRD
jgi:histidine triad (HIT) family protein